MGLVAQPSLTATPRRVWVCTGLRGRDVRAEGGRDLGLRGLWFGSPHYSPHPV